MALESVVYPQDPFGSRLGGGALGYGFGFQGEDKGLLGVLENTNNMEHCLFANSEDLSPSVVSQNVKEWDPNSPSPPTEAVGELTFPPMEPRQTAGRRKRRRPKIAKNKEELEKQRMTHIAVERNRRKQMNEYLAVLRSLIPPSYVQRGDKASIIGGTINYVKEVEQLLQSMESHNKPDNSFSEFFTFPQYYSTHPKNESNVGAGDEKQWGVADIEVSMVDTHANLKILAKKQPRQLLKLVSALQTLSLTVLHLNVTTLDQMVFYSVSVKAEEGCQLSTVDEIAAAVNQILRRIQEEARLVLNEK